MMTILPGVGVGTNDWEVGQEAFTIDQAVEDAR
jgi:hypothetical protein